MYNLLITPSDPHLSCIADWERDLNRTFSPQQKQCILHFTYKPSICTKMKENNFKILTRWYKTPARLSKIFPASSDRCWRCEEERGTLLHVFWTCPIIAQFWLKVKNIAQKFTDQQIPDDPAFFLLHVTASPAKSYKKINWHSQIMHSAEVENPTISDYWDVAQESTTNQ